jgi:hypothetical protein
LTKNRIIEYPGEELFNGEIRYGMNDDTPYDKLKDSTIAILGNGAFAVENARTCLECEGKKAYIVTRRKNLASPRLPCWFVHQGPAPVPGWLVLNSFKPMYALCGWEDPWTFWSVHGDAARTHARIIQNSRFGIGDVTFLMVAYGLLEYRVGTVKRMSQNTLHLNDGSKIEGVNIVLKALGLLGDYSVDKLHKMKEMVGSFCGGDWRRTLTIDDTGMNAANFMTFSTGIRGADLQTVYMYLYNYPKEMYKVQDELFKQLLRHKEEPELEKPAYLSDVQLASHNSFTLQGFFPKMAPLSEKLPAYKYTMYHASHGTDRTLEVAIREWNQYQATWKARGIQHDYVPYPYDRTSVQGWCDTYNAHWAAQVKDWVNISVDGPPKDTVKTATTFKYT